MRAGLAPPEASLLTCGRPPPPCASRGRTSVRLGGPVASSRKGAHHGGSGPPAGASFFFFFTLITSLKAFSPNTVSFGGPGVGTATREF